MGELVLYAIIGRFGLLKPRKTGDGLSEWLIRDFV